jgi:hypothetical protein
MRVLYASLIGFVAVLMLAPPAAAGNRAFPSWDQQISNPRRFKVLGDFADAAVLDKETGLVWEQSPRTDTLNWFNAHLVCNNKSVNGRFG